jgi:anti-sigma factor RsiW
MSCKQEDELTAYVDAELSPTETQRVRTHLLGCAQCRATEALLRRTLSSLEALPAFEPSLALRRNVLARLDSLPLPLSERFRGWLRPGVLLPSAAGLLAASVVALFLAGSGGQKSLPAELADGSALDVAMNYEVVADYEVLGLDSPDDVDVVAHLNELEGRP